MISQLFTTKQLVDKIIAFCEIIQGFPFYTYQRGLLVSLIYSILELDGETITELIARQSGKSTGIAAGGLGLAMLLPKLAQVFPDDVRLQPYINGFWAGIYAPKQDQSEIVINKMKFVRDRQETLAIMAEEGIKMKVSRGDTFVYDHGSKIFAKSASPDTKIEGETLHLVINDEAHGLTRQKVEKEIQPQLDATGGSELDIGTVGYTKEYFYHEIKRNLMLQNEAADLGEKIRRKHFQYDYKAVIKEKRRMYEATGNLFHVNYEKKMAKRIKRFGGIDNAEQNREFRMNYMLLWDDTISNFLSEKSIESMFNQKKMLIGTGMYTEDFTPVQCAGLDFGRTKDSTVLVVCRFDENMPIEMKMPSELLPEIDVESDDELETLELEEKREDDEERREIELLRDSRVYFEKLVFAIYEIVGSWDKQLDQIVDILTWKHAVRVLCADATGAGSPLVERLEDTLQHIDVIPYLFNIRSNDDLYRYYYHEITAGRNKLAAHPESRKLRVWQKFVDQHNTVEGFLHGRNNQYITCEAPEGSHEDFFVAGALCNWAVKVYGDTIMPYMDIEDNPFFGRTQSGKKITHPGQLPQGWPGTTAISKQFPNRLVEERVSYRDRRSRRATRRYL